MAPSTTARYSCTNVASERSPVRHAAFFSPPSDLNVVVRADLAAQVLVDAPSVILERFGAGDRAGDRPAGRDLGHHVRRAEDLAVLLDLVQHELGLDDGGAALAGGAGSADVLGRALLTVADSFIVLAGLVRYACGSHVGESGGGIAAIAAVRVVALPEAAGWCQPHPGPATAPAAGPA
jgi:hypothetical protein